MTSYLIMKLTCHFNYYFVDQGLLVLELLSQLKYSLHHKYQRIVRACVGRPRPVCPHWTEMGHEVHRDRQWEY